VSEQVIRESPPKNTTVKLSTHYTPTLSPQTPHPQNFQI